LRHSKSRCMTPYTGCPNQSKESRFARAVQPLCRQVVWTRRSAICR
jgi:hypothetical protein